MNGGHNEQALLASFCKQFQDDFAAFQSMTDLSFSFLPQRCLAEASPCPGGVQKG